MQQKKPKKTLAMMLILKSNQHDYTIKNMGNH